MKPRTARFIGWSLVAVYLTLAAVGLTLQFLTNTSYTDVAFPVLLIIIPLIGIWPVIGALIIARHPRHPVGWLLSLGLLGAAFDMFFSGYVSYDTKVYAGTLPGMTVALLWLKWSAFPFATTAFTLMILLFPDGRPPSPFWRKVAWLAVGTLLFYLPIQAVEPGAVDPFTGISLNNPLGVSPSLWAILEQIWLVGLVMLALCNLAAVISLILRLRRARGDERQQIKWLVIPAVGFFTHIPFSILGLVETSAQALGIAIALALPAVAGMVIATAFAIFKYRLYDIDLIVNRTLVYGSLTLLVIGIYVLVVGTLGTFFQAQGNLVIALLATGIIAVLFQPLRERLQRGVNRLFYGQRDDPLGALSQLGKRLEAAIAPEVVLPTLVETIAHTLRLPHVAISLRSGDKFKIAAETGDEGNDVIRIPLVYQGATVGQLIAGPRGPGESFSQADRQLLENIAHQAGPAAYAVQLTQDLRRSRVRLVTAREEERRRLRRDLHDGLGPVLASQGLKMAAVSQLIDDDPDKARQLLEALAAQNEATVAEIRRLVYELRPAALDDLGLVGAVCDYASGLKSGTQNAPRLQVDVQAPAAGLPSLPAAIEVAAYRIATEALTNVARHAQARHAAVSFALLSANHARNLRNLHLEVVDDGIGLPEDCRSGVGLISMRERAEEVGGHFLIESSPGRGTRLVADLPLAEAA